MSQSGWILAALIAGFVFWLAVNQRLGTYWSFLIGPADAGAATTPATATPAAAASPFDPSRFLAQAATWAPPFGVT